MSTSAGVANGATENIWNNIKTGLLKTAEEVCGTSRPHGWCRETWWWNEHVEKAIAAKPKAFKAWKTGKGTRASYDAAKRNARHAVHHARQAADKMVYENIDPKSSEVYHLANQFRRENIDVVGDKPVKNDAGEMSVSEVSKQKAWLEHYLVKKAISQMKAGKALDPSGIVVIRAASDMVASMICDLAAANIRDGKVPSDWEQFHCLPLPGKGGHIGKGQLMKVMKAGHESPGEDCGPPHQTVGVSWRFPVWLS